MEYKFIDREIKYTGSELQPHWIYKNHDILGNSIVAFIGEVDVKLSEMVDVEDVKANQPIYSKKMLNFISEQFNIGLVEGVLRQRLLCGITANILTQKYGKTVLRNGDDLFFDGKKLSVSIATSSYNSVLIHFAMNIISEGAAIEVSGLTSELKIYNIKELALDIMSAYADELNDIESASYKVSGRG